MVSDEMSERGIVPLMKHSRDYPDDFVVLVTVSQEQTFTEKIRLTEYEKDWFKRVHDLLIAKEGMLVA